MRYKVFVIGLDGADFRLINEFKEDLPNLNRLIRGGVYGKLMSTIPCASTVVWASFMTGKNPAKHGIFDFVHWNKNDPTNRGKPVNASLVGAPTLWKILSDNGKKVGVFGVLVTYPPEEVNGFLISGFPLPQDAGDYTYPRSLAGELEDMGWNFADVPTQSYSQSPDARMRFLNELYRRVREKTDATLYLMRKYDWDFFMVHYFETDKVQHEFLNYKYHGLVEKNSFERYGGIVKDFFVKLDNQLGRVLSSLNEDTDIIIISDHGFSPNEGLVHVDTWLMSNGFMALRNSMATKAKYLAFRGGLTPRNLYKLLPSSLKSILLKQEDLKYYSKSTSILPNFIMRLVSLFEKIFLNKKVDIDWSRTVAYTYGNTGFCNIFFNLGASKKLEIDWVAERERLLSGLKKIADPTTKKPIFSTSYLKEEIYSGAFLHEAPDLVAFDPTFKSIVYNHPNLFLSEKVLTENYMAPNRATHNMEGIFVAYGPTFKQGADIIGASIVDIAPTILHLMGLPIPADMDGRVLKETFKEESVAGRRDVRYVPSIQGKKEVYEFTEKDEEEVIRRLKAMGYI